MFDLYYFTFSLQYILLAILVADSTIKLSCSPIKIEFDSFYFGVSFSPFVKQADKLQGYPSMQSYTRENLEIMMEVVSTRFSNLLITGVRADNDNSQETASSFNKDDVRVFSAEAAAFINKRKNDSVLKTFIELERHEISRSQLHSNSLLALDAAKRANIIYPGTVQGLSYVVGNNEVFAKDILNQIIVSRKTTQELGLRLGTSQDCLALLLPPQNTTITKIRREIVKQSDFIICWVEPATRALDFEVEGRFRDVGSILLKLKNTLKKFNPKIEVMAMTSWSGQPNFIDFNWLEANEWAIKNNVLVFLAEAFDNPLRKAIGQSDRLGWWKLKRNSEINCVDGYVEKISESHRTNYIGKDDFGTGTKWSIELFVAVMFGSTVKILISTTVGFVVWKAKFIKLHRRQPKGSLQPQAEDNEYNVELAAYDRKKYEIRKEDIEIDNSNDILGISRGTIKRARVKLHNGKFSEVALKMSENFTLNITYMLHELKMLAYLCEHPNIIKLIGAYTAEVQKGTLYVAVELCSLGTLQSYLRAQSDINDQDETGYYNSSIDRRENKDTHPNIRFSELVRWSKEIACGMEFLERRNVVHILLSTRSVLLSSSRTAKISGLRELSRRLYNNDKMYTMANQKPLPWRWLAVECLKELKFSSKSDVWSFGVTLWEIFSLGQLPHANMEWTERFADDLIEGLRLVSPQYATKEIYQIMFKCWSLHAEDRPTFFDLRADFEIMFLEFAEAYYTDLFENDDDET